MDLAASRLAAIVRWSDDAIVSKTLDGVIMSWNPAAERIFGWTAAEVIGRHITLIIPHDRLSEEDDVLARIRRGELVDHYETVRITKDGRSLDISLTVSPVRDASGRVIGASKIARDITDRKRMEQEREHLLGREREAREAAEAASRAKDQFLATASHELRTPLNAILGWARLMQTGELSAEEGDNAVEVIIRSATMQAKLVEELLDLSRVVTGRLRMTFEPCDLADVVTEALETVRPALDAKGLELSVGMPPGPVPMRGAPDRLRQVVWNLVMNAIKFTPEGGQVGVELQRHGTSARLVVSDTGVGISTEMLPYVFDAFRQEDSSSTRRHGGLGLGLALVRRLVELHGGSVAAASPGKGRGAQFTVVLPVREESAASSTGSLR